MCNLFLKLINMHWYLSHKTLLANAHETAALQSLYLSMMLLLSKAFHLFVPFYALCILTGSQLQVSNFDKIRCSYQFCKHRFFLCDIWILQRTCMNRFTCITFSASNLVHVTFLELLRQESFNLFANLSFYLLDYSNFIYLFISIFSSCKKCKFLYFVCLFVYKYTILLKSEKKERKKNHWENSFPCSIV